MKKERSSFEYITGSFAAALVLIVMAIAIMLVWQSWPSLKAFGLKFFVHQNWDPVQEEFGALAFIYGTLVSSLIALLLAVPFSIGIAIFLSELAPRYLTKYIYFLVELLAAIPSVVYGLWGVFVLVPWMRSVLLPKLIAWLGFIPLFSGPAYGIGLFTSGLILALMIVPIIASLSVEIFKAVPISQREAALGLGATKWEMIRLAVLSNAKSGVIGAIFLGLGRALGETMAVTMVIGNRVDIPKSLFAPAYSMASVLANEFTEATSNLYLSSLIEIGLALFLVTLIINVIARSLLWRMNS